MAGYQSAQGPDAPLTQGSQLTSLPVNLPPASSGLSQGPSGITQQHDQEALGLWGPASLLDRGRTKDPRGNGACPSSYTEWVMRPDVEGSGSKSHWCVLFPPGQSQ